MDDDHRRSPGEGSIRYIAQRDLYQVRVTVSPGKRQAAYARTKTEANKLLRAMLTARDRGTTLDARSMTVETLLTDWLEAIGGSRKPSTMHGYESDVRLYLVPGLGRYRVRDLRAEHVDRFLRGLATAPRTRDRKRGVKRALTPRTIAHIRTTLRTALSWAMRRGRVATNAATLSEPPTYTKRRPPTVTAVHVTNLVTAAQADPWGAIYMLALDTGLREGELLGLRWEDVDIDGQHLTVMQSVSRVRRTTYVGTPKSQSSQRTLGFGAIARDMLKTRRAASAAAQLAAGRAWRGKGLVFHDDAGLPIIPTTAYGRWRRFRVRAGLPDGLRIHDLRHASASLLLSDGASLKDVSERLGHSSIAITADIYGHLTSEAQQRTAARMDSILKRHA